MTLIPNLACVSVSVSVPVSGHFPSGKRGVISAPDWRTQRILASKTADAPDNDDNDNDDDATAMLSCHLAAFAAVAVAVAVVVLAVWH